MLFFSILVSYMLRPNPDSRKNRKPSLNIRPNPEGRKKTKNIRQKKWVFLCNGIRWSLFSYWHHNSQSLIIIFVHWTQLFEYWSHVCGVALYSTIFYLAVLDYFAGLKPPDATNIKKNIYIRTMKSCHICIRYLKGIF